MVDHVHVVLGGERVGDAICRTMKCLYSRRVFPRSRRVQDFGWLVSAHVRAQSTLVLA